MRSLKNATRGGNVAIFDSSALLAIFFNERGQDAASALLSDSAISTANTVEVMTRLIDRGWSPQEAQESLDALGLDYVPLDMDVAIAASALREPTRHLGLSLGDRICLALGHSRADQVVTADRHWANLAVGVDIILIR
jgi:ribonuclease VapC